MTREIEWRLKTGRTFASTHPSDRRWTKYGVVPRGKKPAEVVKALNEREMFEKGAAAEAGWDDIFEYRLKKGGR